MEGAAMSAAPDTIVLIHGLYLDANSWEAWANRYASRGHRVVAPSWPGLKGGVEELRRDPTALARSTSRRLSITTRGSSARWTVRRSSSATRPAAR